MYLSERIFVHEDVHDDFVSKAKQRMSDLQVGDPMRRQYRLWCYYQSNSIGQY